MKSPHQDHRNSQAGLNFLPVPRIDFTDLESGEVVQQAEAGTSKLA